MHAWNAERDGLELDEYIDDIPFPETQTYVRRILGTTDDYRRLYGEGTPAVQSAVKPATKAAAKAPAKPANEEAPAVNEPDTPSCRPVQTS